MKKLKGFHGSCHRTYIIRGLYIDTDNKKGWEGGNKGYRDDNWVTGVMTFTVDSVIHFLQPRVV